MSAARYRLKVRRGVEMADAKLSKIVPNSRGIVEAEAGLELDSVGGP